MIDDIRLYNYKRLGKTPNYNFYYKLYICKLILVAILLLMFIFRLINFLNTCLLIIAIIFIIDCLEYLFLHNNIYFNAFVIKNGELYKIGVYPNRYGIIFHKYEYLTPNDDNFRMDKHFLYNIFNNFIIYILSGGREYNASYSGSILKAMINLNNKQFVTNLFNNKEKSAILYKINSIYSFSYLSKDDCYIVICDVLDLYNNVTYNKVRIKVNRNLDNGNELLNYIQSKSLNIDVPQEELYENTDIAKERKKSLNKEKASAIAMLLIFFAVIILITIFAK